jgi:hypothetical protein
LESVARLASDLIGEDAALGEEDDESEPVDSEEDI